MTTVQQEIADWIRGNFLPGRYGTEFARERVTLASGGDHSFAAVSADRTIVGTISSGPVASVTGRLAVTRLNKVRADLYFLMLATCERRLFVATQPVMYQFLKAEQEQYGRIPSGVEILHAELPPELAKRLARAHLEASLH